MAHLQTLIVATKTITLVLGAVITTFAYRAYRRTGARPLRALAIGFAFVTVGGVAGGAFDFLLSIGIRWGVLAQSALTAVGFGVITYSLYAER